MTATAILDLVSSMKQRMSKRKSLSSTEILTLINEYIHNEVHRDILAERLINHTPYTDLERKYGYCTRQLQRIVHDGEKIIYSHI